MDVCSRWRTVGCFFVSFLTLTYSRDINTSKDHEFDWSSLKLCNLLLNLMKILKILIMSSFLRFLLQSSTLCLERWWKHDYTLCSYHTSIAKSVQSNFPYQPDQAMHNFPTGWRFLFWFLLVHLTSLLQLFSEHDAIFFMMSNWMFGRLDESDQLIKQNYETSSKHTFKLLFFCLVLSNLYSCIKKVHDSRSF